ncbi:MAG TPA: MBL fold metallo-hydrolase [Candidatus Baltobacteraceae bacterium]
MIFRILGSAAGGGVPQWNCACANCIAARSGVAPRRTQSGAAVSADGDRWLLLNCSPDIAAQIETFAPLQPRSLRDTPIDGIALTDANVDHLGGLAALRQSGKHRFAICSSPVVRDIAVAQTAFAPFEREPHRWDALADGEWGERFGLRLRGFSVPGTTPGYAGRREDPGAVFAYEIGAPGNGAPILFAPVFSAIDGPLFEAISRATVAILDGSFFSHDELLAGGFMEKTARQLGHSPVGGSGGTLDRLRGVRTRIVFTHVNNSNPMLDPSSAAAVDVRRAGAEIAYDGMTF